MSQTLTMCTKKTKGTLTILKEPPSQVSTDNKFHLTDRLTHI